MKVRMIFGTVVELEKNKPTDLRCDTEPDLPEGVALDLIDRGRAESLEPKKKAPAAGDGKGGEKK